MNRVVRFGQGSRTDWEESSPDPSQNRIIQHFCLTPPLSQIVFHLPRRGALVEALNPEGTNCGCSELVSQFSLSESQMAKSKTSARIVVASANRFTRWPRAYCLTNTAYLTQSTGGAGTATTWVLMLHCSLDLSQDLNCVGPDHTDSSSTRVSSPSICVFLGPASSDVLCKCARNYLLRIMHPEAVTIWDCGNAMQSRRPQPS